MNSQRQIPEWQQAIIDKCYHPTGEWEEFPESEYETSIPARFEKIAARYPDRLAVVDDQQSLTYAELNAAANRLAHGLLARLGPGSEPVVHLFAHTIDAVVALLGIVKAGKFYTPLDARSPADYLHQILGQLESRLVLTDEANRSLAEAMADGLAAVCTSAAVAGEADHNPAVAVAPDDYLYVVFTSGSTGTPKGVIENQRNALRFAASYVNTHHICPEDRGVLSQFLSFSGSKQTLFGTLLSGSCLIFYDMQRHGVSALPTWVYLHSITILTIAPAIFRLLVESDQNQAEFASVRLVRVGADRILPVDLAVFCRLMPNTAILRTSLGASEAKTSSEIFYDKAWAGKTEKVSMGWPMLGIEMLILDDAGDPVEPGETGEIIVHSRFVSPGYWKDPALTAQKFHADPVANGFFYYHSGDLGYIGKDGQIYFLGRKDFQVKIRGQRVELGEIEQALWSVKGVTGAVAGIRGDSPDSAQLIAWIECQGDTPAPTASYLRRWLAERLPPHMIPQRFVFLDRFPLNLNDKIDRLSLPMPTSQRPWLDSLYLPPQTPLEIEVAQVWSEVLEIDEIGIHDPFLDLGGHSLQAMRIAARVQDEFGVEIPLAELFAAATVAEMAVVVTAALVGDSATNLSEVHFNV